MRTERRDLLSPIILCVALMLLALPATTLADPVAKAGGCLNPLVDAPATSTYLVRPSEAGCGVIEVDSDVTVVREVRIVEVKLDPEHLIVRYVLLDEDDHRVVFRLSQRLRHEFKLKKSQKGKTNIRKVSQTDGIYELKLAPASRPEPCEMQLHLRFDNGGEALLEDWIDDWLYDC